MKKIISLLIIVAIVASGGASLPVSIASALLSGVIGGVVGTLIDGFDGTVRCRKYTWDYRVRHNSNTGTILKTAYKCRYWWEMYDKQGNRSFEPREDVADGWLLSNRELIAHALGRS